MQNCKKLIEVAMPIKEISAESVRDKSIRHGHISTLHLWWARRPLPVCRAVVFASLVPDPLDENCPQAFKDAVEILLGKANNPGDPYKPYEDIPYTAAVDKMEDNLRNRLLMFIGKFSDRFINNERIGKKTDAKDQLSDFSLIKWDNKNNEEIIGKARKLIWVSYNSNSGIDAVSILHEYDIHSNAIRYAENELYSITDRHLKNKNTEAKEQQLSQAINSFLCKMPKTFDPFAGGGAIPLETARLGCRSYGNDINPVAHIIQKGSVEYPQIFGKPIKYSKDQFINLYGENMWNQQPQLNKVIKNGEAIEVLIENRLTFDVEFYCKRLLEIAKDSIIKYYPIKDANKLVAYYWSYFARCSNPSCQAHVPLLRNFYLCNKPDKRIYLSPIVELNRVVLEIKHGNCDTEPFIQRKNLKCPCCGNITDIGELKSQFNAPQPYKRIIAGIEEGRNQKVYRLPTKEENDILSSLPKDIEIPQEIIPIGNNRDLHLTGWGPRKWGDMFGERQLLAMHSFVKALKAVQKEYNQYDEEYAKALSTYLAMFINRLATRLTSFGLYNTIAETIEHPFGRQAIPFVFDYPEVFPFSNSGGGGLSQLDWIIRYIEGESTNPFHSHCINASSGDIAQFDKKSINGVITDPPYYDAIAYADLSDFFYVWLKRSISDLYPQVFSTPQTPKSEECTALKHHHDGDAVKANHHFEQKLLQIFDTIEQQTSDLISIMFAHQSTEAWSTLCNSILGARMNITGSWAIDTERSSAGVKTKNAFLSSSVTVSCKPVERSGIGDYKFLKKEIEKNVSKEVEELYKLGFRGADLLTACFGQAVSVFGKYNKVEKADGSRVAVSELLELAKESAFNALLKGFDGDDFTKFYIGWLQLYGFAESDFDDAAKFSRVGLNINVSELFQHNLFIKKGNKQELAGYRDRLEANSKIGEGGNTFIIDYVHRAMALYSGTNRKDLLTYVSKVAPSSDSSFWRVITSLCEVLPQGSEDYKQANGLLLNKESLLRESKTIQQSKDTQGELF
jgi:adenine-specific DNA methylase